MEKLNAHIEEVGAGYKILLAGRVTDEELCALYQTAEVFCLPSIFRAEAFGVVLLEAMSYGLPIVATDIEGSGVPWVNQHGVSGLNVEVKNSEELAKACTQIITDPALQMRLGQGARQRYEINFTNKIFTENFLEIYKKLL
jgi:glycosyltransferase involved in cell wall biosynthesis